MLKSRRQLKKGIIFLVLGLAVLSFFLWKSGAKTKVDYYVLRPRDLSYTILANCTVDYPKPLDMSFLQEGIIRTIEVKEGDRVAKGQKLIELDDFEARQNLVISAESLKTAQLKLKNAREEVLPNLKEKLNEYEANLERARLNLERYRKIEASGGIPRSELEKAEKEYQRALSQYNQQKLEVENFSTSGLLASLENQVSTSRAQYELAVKRVEDTRIHAPFEGSVLKIHVQPGQKVTPATKAITLLENASWQLVLNVDQKELPFLRAGLPAQVMMDAYPDKKIEATVSYVCTEVDKEKNTCELRVEIKEDIPFIKYGMAGKAEILAARFENVLALPSRFVKKDAGQNYLWLWDGRKASLVPVDIKPVGERWVLVEGVAAEKVVLDAEIRASASKLRPGKQIAGV